MQDYSLRQGLLSEREYIKDLVITSHLECTCNNDEELQIQKKDLCCDFNHLYNDSLFLKQYTIIVENKNKEIVGCICIKKEDNINVHLSSFHVKKEERGKGIGKLLFEEALYYSKNVFKCKFIQLISLENRNRIAIKMYEKYSFKRIKTENPIPNYIVVWFEKEL